MCGENNPESVSIGKVCSLRKPCSEPVRGRGVKSGGNPKHDESAEGTLDVLQYVTKATSCSYQSQF